MDKADKKTALYALTEQQRKAICFALGHYTAHLDMNPPTAGHVYPQPLLKAIAETLEKPGLEPLFYINYNDANGDDRDLLVRTTTAEDAFLLWRKHYELEDEPDMPDSISLVPATNGVLDWGDIFAAALPIKPPHD